MGLLSRGLVQVCHAVEEAMGLAREYPPAQMRIVQEGSFKEDRVAA
jgi:hypothetical protein